MQTISPTTPRSRRRAARVLLSTLIGAASLLATGVTNAQGAWPTRPVKLIVHAPAGGGADAYARAVGDGLSKLWGQPVVIDNKAGANGLIATKALMTSAPDGYTLMQTATGPVAMNPIMHGKMYDPAVAFTAIAPVTSTYMIVVAGVDQPFSDLSSLATYAKAHPKEVTYATAGIGAVPHIGTEFINVALGAGMTHVPFRGESQFIPELLAGRVSMAMMIAGSALPYIQSGKFKAIAVTSSERNPALPNVKTMEEQGFKVSLPLWFGLIGPAGMPADLARKINDDVNKVLQTPAIQKRFADLLVDVPKASSTEDFRKYMVGDAHKWATLVKQANVSLKAE